MLQFLVLKLHRGHYSVNWRSFVIETDDGCVFLTEGHSPKLEFSPNILSFSLSLFLLQLPLITTVFHRINECGPPFDVHRVPQ